MLILKAIIYTLIAFCLLYFAAKKRDSAKVYNIIMFFCWVVIALSMDSYDIGNYRWGYEQGLYISKEPFYDLLQRIFSGCRIPFAIFKLLYGTGIWVLVYRALKNYTVETALAAAVFVFGPMLGFGTQMRSSMAGAIILNALPILLKKDAKIWKYCALVAVATLFHMMALFYLTFLLPKYLRISAKKFRNYMCLIAAAMIPVVLLLFKPLYNLFTAAQTWTNISLLNTVFARLAQYFSGEMSPNMTGFLFTFCAHFVVFFLTDRVCVAMLALRGEKAVKADSTRCLSRYAINYLRKLNSFMVLMLPCYIVSLQFDRFNNYFVPVCYCLIVQGARELNMVGNAPKLEIPEIKWERGNRLIQWINRTEALRVGNAELLVLVACLVFCFFVCNRYSATSEFVRIVNGIGLFGGPQ